MFFKEKKKFESSLQVVREIFECNNRIPNQVFKSLNYFLICDFDKALGSLFQDELENILLTSDDDYLIMGVLDPDPVSFFYKEYGCYNWLHIFANMSKYHYWDLLNMHPTNNPIDILLINTNVVVWASPTKKWAIWGERDYGIAILGFDKNSKLKQQIKENDTWGKMDDDFATLVSYNFKDFKLPKNIKEKLFLHYQNVD